LTHKIIQIHSQFTKEIAIFLRLTLLTREQNEERIPFIDNLGKEEIGKDTDAVL
jgi:hypothetical protein